MRKAIWAVLALGLLASASHGQQPMSKDERAYTITLMCNAIAASDSDYEGSARSMEAARKMAKALGYNSKRLSSDLITMASVVGVQLRDEPAKVAQRREVCRQLGLLN